MSISALKNEKEFAWPSMTAPMDIRSQPDQVTWGHWRFVLNSRAVEKGKACRREGWRRFGYQTGHPNSDLHDQHGGTGRIRTIYSHKNPTRTNSGNRLYAGAETNLWESRSDGGWRNVGEDLPMGGDWEFTSLNDIVIAANSKRVLWHRPDIGVFTPIPSLAKIGLTGASVAWVFEGTLFLADVVMDNSDVGHRVVWADLNSIEFEPTTDSIAGFRDLMAGERILAAVPTGTSFTIFTTHGAWRQGVANGQFVFQQLYFSKTRDACPIGKRAIVSNREIAYFIASDGIYALAPYSPAPEWSEWMNQGLPLGFIQDDRCVVTASAYDPIRNEILWSAATLGQTYVVNLRQTSTSMIDHAFIAMTPADIDRGQSIGMWWVASGICSPAEIEVNYPVKPRDDPRIYPDAPATMTTDGCLPFDPPCDICDGVTEFVAVSAIDNAIKVFPDDFYAREMRVGNAWVLEGYATRFVTGSLTFGIEAVKRVGKVAMNFTAGAADVPGGIRLIVGTSGSAVDPMADFKPATFVMNLSTKKLVAPPTPIGDAPNIQPLAWTFLADGRFVFFELRIDAATGAAACFSTFTAHITRSTNSPT